MSEENEKRTFQNCQFKKGQSGNPKGRPPKKRLSELLNEMLQQTIEVNIEGKKQKMTYNEYIVRKLLEICLEGQKETTILNAIREVFDRVEGKPLPKAEEPEMPTAQKKPLWFEEDNNEAEEEEEQTAG